MEDGAKTKKTVFIGGVADDVDEAVLYETFSTFGDIIEVQLPSAATNPTQQQSETTKHRGFAFVTYGSSGDAQDAIDNMDMNELHGKVLKVNLARPTKHITQLPPNRAVWESEEWLQQHLKPLNQNRGGSKEAQAQNQEQNDGDDDNGMKE